MQINNKVDGKKDIYCKYIINCNGPYYNKIVVDELNDLDIKLRLNAVRIQLIHKYCPKLFEYSSDLASIPFIMDYLSGVHIKSSHKNKTLIICTCSEKDERDIFDPDDELPSGADPEMRNRYLNSMYHRLLPINELIGFTSAVKSMSGLYTVCHDDVHYLIGPTKLDGFIVCNGFSGHGFKCAPAVGSMLAQYLTNIRIPDDTDVDIKFFSPYRSPYVMSRKMLWHNYHVIILSEVE